MCILIRAALSLPEGIVFLFLFFNFSAFFFFIFSSPHINLSSCQSSLDQSTNVLTSGAKLSRNIKRATFRRPQAASGA